MAAHENLSGQQFWRNEQGDFEPVSPEVYAQKRAELKQQNQHAIDRGDRFFKDE